MVTSSLETDFNGGQSSFNPIALRKAKIVYNFDLYTILAFLSALGLKGCIAISEQGRPEPFTEF